MHAFLDESRIPPEERRSIAKDTEDLVHAAQPDASPLALEAISQHYVETYSRPSLTRVADAFGLTVVTKKLAHQTVPVQQGIPDDVSVKTEPAGCPKTPAKAFPSPSGSF